MEYKKIAKKSATITGNTFWIIIKEFFLSLFYLLNPVGKLSRKYFVSTNIFCLFILGLGFLYFPLLGNYFPKFIDQIYLYSFSVFMGLLFLNLQRKRIRDMDGSLWFLVLQFIPTHTMMIWHNLLFSESQSQHPDPTEKLGYKPASYTHPVSFWMRSYVFLFAFSTLIVGLLMNDYITPYFQIIYQNNILNYSDLFMPVFDLVSKHTSTVFDSFFIFKSIYLFSLYLLIHLAVFLLSIFCMLTLRHVKKYEF